MAEPPTGPLKLLRYFERCDRERPDAHWQAGVAMCRLWLELLEAEVQQADVDAFLARLEAERNPGSGWVDLGMQFRFWARSSGFKV